MKAIRLMVRSAAAAVLVWMAALAVIVGGNSGCPTISGSLGLSGGNEVPPNGSDGSGTGIYELSADGTELRFDITASGLTGPVTAAHFHNAETGSNGPVVLNLAPFLTEVNGMVTVEGTSLLADWSIDNVAEEIQAGRIYVNLHTANFPNGEIRGLVVVTE